MATLHMHALLVLPYLLEIFADEERFCKLFLTFTDLSIVHILGRIRNHSYASCLLGWKLADQDVLQA